MADFFQNDSICKKFMYRAILKITFFLKFSDKELFGKFFNSQNKCLKQLTMWNYGSLKRVGQIRAELGVNHSCESRFYCTRSVHGGLFAYALATRSIIFTKFGTRRLHDCYTPGTRRKISATRPLHARKFHTQNQYAAVKNHYTPATRQEISEPNLHGGEISAPACHWGGQ